MHEWSKDVDCHWADPYEGGAEISTKLFPRRASGGGVVPFRATPRSPAFLVDVFVPRTCLPEHLEVDVTARRCSVKVEGWGEWKRHWAYPCRVDESSWSLVDFDGRRRVQLTCYFHGLPREGEGSKTPDAVKMSKLKHLFLEDQDDHFALCLAQTSCFMDYGPRFMAEEDLLPSAKKVLASMRRDREGPRGEPLVFRLP